MIIKYTLESRNRKRMLRRHLYALGKANGRRHQRWRLQQLVQASKPIENTEKTMLLLSHSRRSISSFFYNYYFFFNICSITQWFSQIFMTTAGPRDRAGFMLAPVYWIWANKKKILTLFDYYYNAHIKINGANRYGLFPQPLTYRGQMTSCNR